MKKGKVISYEKEIMFKGTQTVTAKVVMFDKVTGIVLLDNGDQFRLVGDQLYRA